MSWGAIAVADFGTLLMEALEKVSGLTMQDNGGNWKLCRGWRKMIN